MIAWQERELGRHGLLLERKEVSIGHCGKSKPCERTALTICLAGAASGCAGAYPAALSLGFLALGKEQERLELRAGSRNLREV